VLSLVVLVVVVAVAHYVVLVVVVVLIQNLQPHQSILPLDQQAERNAQVKTPDAKRQFA
jgi:hypothetical protein